MKAPTVTVETIGQRSRASIQVGDHLTFEAVRVGAREAREAVLAMYEDAVFGFDRGWARAWREKRSTGSVSPQTRRRSA